MTQKVLLTGATGAVGPAVARELVRTGFAVRAMARSQPPRGLLDGVEIVPGDLRDARSIVEAARDVDRVVHMGGLLHLFGAGRERDADFELLNVESTRVLTTLSGRPPVVLFSTIAVYGAGGMFDEDSVPAPETAYARTKLEAERVVLAAGGTVLRLAAVYGRRMKGNYASLVRAIAAGRFVAIGRGQNHRTLVHDEDVARAVGLVVQTPAPGRIYNVTDGTTHALSDIIDAIAEGLGRRPPRLRVPLLPVRLAGTIVPPIGRLLTKYVEEIRVDGSRMIGELGYRPRYDLRAGWVEALRQWR